MINPYKLEIFTQVVQAGSFSRAAQGLLMTQSAISQHIHDLEISLGTKLFTRGPRGVSLTAAGETLHSYTLEIFALLAEAENAITNVANLEHGEVRVGATPGTSVYLLPDYTVSFRVKFPNLAVFTKTGTSAEILDSLRAGQLDMGIIEGEVDEKDSAGLKIEPLYEFEQLVIIGPKHPWWNRNEISLIELEGQDFIMRQPSSQTRIWLDTKLAEHGIHPQISTVFDNLESIKRAITRGRCLTIMPIYTVQEEIEHGKLQALPIAGHPLQRMLKLVRRERKSMSPPANAFLAHVKSHLLHNYKQIAHDR